jgi:ferrous iron transport protein B
MPATTAISATIALVGNPNAGKTTLFNALTGENQRVGNYSGITVAVRSGTFFTPHGRKMRVLDLPGCYSLHAGSPDEQLAVDALTGALPDEAAPDLVVCVVDASNLERHLQLVLQVIELGRPCVLALNMIDTAERAGLRLDTEKLAEELGIPVVPLQANAGKGVVAFKQALRFPLPQAAPAPWLANATDADSARRAYVLRVCQLAARRPTAHQLTSSDRADAILLHPLWGWLTFAAVVLTVLWSMFSLAKIPMQWIEAGQAATGAWVEARMAAGDLRSLLVEGVLGGVCGVLVFLPQILLLFLFVGLLESTGYMARAAYLMDGFMARAGLSGKAFLPLFSSFACAVPGVMATRTIDSAKERLTAIFVLPWMSCSARLPVYLLLVPMLLGGAEGSWRQALVLFAIYALGAGSAFVVARLLRSRLGPDPADAHFLLELPPYRQPQWSYIGRHLAERAWAFIAKAGTLILGLSILLWALSAYPKPPAGEDSDALAHSAMGRIGAVIEPVFKPMGLDGRTGTAILTSLAAREVFNSSMAILFRAEGGGDEEAGRGLLRERLRSARWSDGRPLFTPLAVVALLVFYIYALQCLPTVAVVARETASWRWALGQLVFMTSFAWLAATLIYQLGRWSGLS